MGNTVSEETRRDYQILALELKQIVIDKELHDARVDDYNENPNAYSHSYYHNLMKRAQELTKRQVELIKLINDVAKDTLIIRP